MSDSEDYIDRTRNERNDFLKGTLTNVDFDDPMAMFNAWYKQVHDTANCDEPYAVTLTTATTAAAPSSRIVYLRDLTAEGMVVYTNYKSRKGEEIDQNPQASLLFFWSCLERQVRIEGTIEKVSAETSDAYFANRPRISQIGAWASEQSHEIKNRAELEERVANFENKFPNDVPRLPHWGGFIIKPAYYEFWQGRKGRLHDRICFEKQGENWRIFRIAP